MQLNNVASCTFSPDVRLVAIRICQALQIKETDLELMVFEKCFGLMGEIYSTTNEEEAGPGIIYIRVLVSVLTGLTTWSYSDVSDALLA